MRFLLFFICIIFCMGCSSTPVVTLNQHKISQSSNTFKGFFHSVNQKNITVVVAKPQRTDDKMERSFDRLKKGAEDILQRSLEQEFSRISKITTISDRHLKDILKREQIEMSDLYQPGKIQLIGNLLKSDYIVVSKIDKCTKDRQSVTTENGIIEYDESVVEFEISILNRKKPGIDFSESISGRGKALLSKSSVEFEIDVVENALKDNKDGDKLKIADENQLLKRLVQKVAGTYTK